jgi:hypothetical protein
MQVQFLAGIKKDRSRKVARLKEFELLAIRLNDSNIEVIPTVSKKPLPKTSPMKCTVESVELLASYIARLERLEDNNETNSSTPKANPQGSHPSLTPLPVNNGNFAYGLTPNPASQYPPFQPHGPNMAAPVEPMQGTGQTGVMDLVPDQALSISIVPSQMVPTFYNTISNVGPHYSTTINASASKNIILDDVFESYRVAQAKIAPYLNKMNLENPQPPQPNNPNWAEFNRFKEDLANVVKNKLGVDIGNTNLYQKPYDPEFDSFPLPRGWRMTDLIKFSGDDDQTTWEHISQYIAQLGEAGVYNALKVCLFSLSLTGTAFSWFSSLAPGSIISWDMLERKFHDHFHSGSIQLKLTDLTSVRQGRDETVSAYIKRFKETKNRCFNLSITDMDLAEICLKGLRSSIRDKIEGSDFLSVAQVQVRSLVVENRMNKEKNNFKSRHSNVHIIDYDFDRSNDSDKEVYAAEFVWPSEEKSYSCSSLKPASKSRQKLNLFLMFPNVIVYLMNCLNLEITN